MKYSYVKNVISAAPNPLTVQDAAHEWLSTSLPKTQGTCFKTVKHKGKKKKNERSRVQDILNFFLSLVRRQVPVKN